MKAIKRYYYKTEKPKSIRKFLALQIEAKKNCDRTATKHQIYEFWGA